MRVLLNRISNRISGAEIYNIALLKSLKRYKDLDIIFSSDNSELNNRVKSLGFRIRPIYPQVNEIGTKKQFLYACITLPLYVQRYFDYFRKVEKIDIVIFESMTEKIFLTLPLRLFGKKVIWIEHGPLFNTRRALIIKWLYKIESTYVNKIICVSQSTREDLVSNGISNQKSVVVYIGIDENEFAPFDTKQIFKLRSNLGLNKTDIIGFLGTVTREKGIVDFLEAATLMIKERKNIHFLVIGDGNMLVWAKSEVARRNISNKFHFTGFVKNVKDYLGMVDVLLFPSHHQEGLSIALLEASSLGIPIVATDIGGNNEIVVNNFNGKLFKNSSFNNVKSILLEVLYQKKSFKINARKVILEKFSMEENGRKFIQLFKEVYHGK